jgi:hypothetical protein
MQDSVVVTTVVAGGILAATAVREAKVEPAARESAPAAPTAPKAETERAPPDRLRVPEF